MSQDAKRRRLAALLAACGGLQGADPGDALDRQRRLFPALESKAYFNYGGQGPLPQPARDAIVEAFDQLQVEGPFSIESNLWAREVRARARQGLADFLGGRAADYSLTESITTAVNIVLWGLEVAAGDHVVVSDAETPGVLSAVRQWARRRRLEVSVCDLLGRPQGRLEALAAALRPRTRLVIVSHVLWNSGEVQPIAEMAALCRRHGSRPRLLVDGGQSVGQLDLDLAICGADYYAFTAQKWCCGPAGVAALYVAPGAADSLEPTFAGWRGLVPDSDYRLRSDGRRFEVGSSSLPLLAGLAAALTVHGQWGSAAERAAAGRGKAAELARWLTSLAGVELLTPVPETGIVALRCPRPRQVVADLEAQGILVREMASPHCLRVCTHYLTSGRDLERLRVALAEALERLPVEAGEALP
ncbi:MAG: aminotransferase class V-fold PLP-dependent enzyme [Acidobacteriota bacterium]